MSRVAYENNSGVVTQTDNGTSSLNEGTTGGEKAHSAAMPRMQLTKAELEVLEQCRVDSFYKRSLPLSVAFMAAVQVLTRRGTLALHPRWGAYPKVFGAGALGFFMGKLSYASTCRDKLLQVEGGTIAQAVRARRDGQHPMAGFAGQSETVTEQLGEGEASDEVHDDDSVVQNSARTTYESLRSRHRQEQEAASGQRRSVAAYNDLQQQRARAAAATQQQPAFSAAAGGELQGKGKNKYGDVWEE